MSFKTLVSISKNDESDIKVLRVVVTSDISVSTVAAKEDEELLLILAGFATIFDEGLIFLYEADKYLSTCSFDEVFSLVLADLVYRLPWNIRLYTVMNHFFVYEKQQISAFYFHPYQFKHCFIYINFSEPY